jgi:hypothetical protein
MKHQKNSILLVAFHVLVLLSPLLAKGFHRHENLLDRPEFFHEKTVSQANSHCFICDFEYVNVVSPENIKLPSVFASISIPDTFLSQVPFFPFVYYYSLRAPPAC